MNRTRFCWRIPRRMSAIAAAAGAVVLSWSVVSAISAPPARQPVIEARGAPVLNVAGLQFKDLNRNGKLDVYEDWRQPAEVRVADLVPQMTLEEEVGEMFAPRLSFGGSGRDAAAAMLARNARNFLNNGEISSARDAARWSNETQEAAEAGRLGIPICFFSDPRWLGEVIAVAQTRDLDLMRRFGAVTARRFRAVGLHEGHTAYLDVATEPRWFRVASTFGEDAELCARMVCAYMDGFQGPEPNPETCVFFAVIFPGSGPREGGADPHAEAGRNSVYPGRNFDYHLIPWKAAIKHGLWKVMPYYAIPTAIDTLSANFSKKTIDGLLRSQLGYDRLVCSDWDCLGRAWGMNRASRAEKLTAMFNAGVDQHGCDQPYEKETVALVTNGTITVQRVNQAAGRVLLNKFKLGLFENPYADEAKADGIWNSEEMKDVQRQIFEKSAVLLKNSGILPLKAGTRVYTEYLSAKVLEQVGGRTAKAIEEADVVVVEAKHPWRDWPECLKPEQLSQPFVQERRQLAAAEKAGKPVVIVAGFRNPLILTPLIRRCEAMLGVVYAGEQDAISRLLFGTVKPVGRLAWQMPRDAESVQNQKEDVPFDLAYPLWPYDFGMGYNCPPRPKLESRNVKVAGDGAVTLEVRCPKHDYFADVDILQGGRKVGTVPVGLKAGTWIPVRWRGSVDETGTNSIGGVQSTVAPAGGAREDGFTVDFFRELNRGAMDADRTREERQNN